MLKISRLFLWLVLIVLLLVLIVSVAVHYYPATQQSPVSQTGTQNIPHVSLITKSKLSGDDQAAFVQYQSVQNDPTKSDEDKALASVLYTGSGLGRTGDPQEVIADVQRLESIVRNTKLSARIRANALCILATLYNDSGRNPAVLAEIYKEAPFSQYIVPGSPSGSAENLAKWSYSLYPSSNAAITVAQSEVGYYFSGNPQSASTTAAHVAMAEDYLKKANAATLQESAEDPLYSNGERYMEFRTWRAIIIGRLAIEKGEPYKSQYRKEFDDFFVFEQPLKSSHAKDESFYVRKHYAQILGLDKDAAAEKVQLDLLAQALNELKNPDLYGFVWSLRYEHKYRPTEQAWMLWTKLFEVSPNLKAAVDALIASTPTTQ